jgi:hypothetical protein
VGWVLGGVAARLRPHSSYLSPQFHPTSPTSAARPTPQFDVEVTDFPD